MSEERLRALEIGQQQMIKNYNTLFKQQAELDKSMITLITKLDIQREDDRKRESTLQNINNTVNNMALSYAHSPHERSREMEEKIHPIWDRLREHEKMFVKCPVEIKEDINKSTLTHFKILWAALIVICLLGTGLISYIYVNDKNTAKELVMDLKDDIDGIQNHILDHHSGNNKK